MRDHRNLVIWQKAHALTLAAHRAAAAFPKNERYGLTAEVQRMAAAIPTDIAESCEVEGAENIADCLRRALASATELKFQLQRARKVEFLPESLYRQLDADTREVERMLTTLVERLQQA